MSELEAIKELTICNLDLSGNPVAEKEGYREKVFEIFPDLEVLDGNDKEGNEVDSVEEDYDDEEDGEMEEIDEETLKKMREQGFDLADDDEEYGEEFLDDDEEGEDEDYGDEDGEDDEEAEEPAQKRRK